MIKMMAVKAMLNKNIELNAFPLNALIVLVSFMFAHAMSWKSENDYNDMISFYFLRFLKSIGQNGVKDAWNLSNKGNLLKNGR